MPSSHHSRLVRIIAALLLASFAAPLISFAPPLGLLLAGAGLGLAAWQGILMVRERRDPYDLSELERVHERLIYGDELDVDDGPDRELAYCHHCGTSTASRNSVCPSCGTPLGS